MSVERQRTERRKLVKHQSFINLQADQLFTGQIFKGLVSYLTGKIRYKAQYFLPNHAPLPSRPIMTDRVESTPTPVVSLHLL